MQSNETILRLLSVDPVRFLEDSLSNGILKAHGNIVSLLYSITVLPLNRIHAASLECFPPRHTVRIQERRLADTDSAVAGALAESIIVESGGVKHATIIPYCCESQHFSLTVKN